jgi:hypothetical protein
MDLTVDEWCAKRKCCRATFYNLRSKHKAPRVIYVGSRPRITPEADAQCQAEREAEAEPALQGAARG